MKKALASLVGISLLSAPALTQVRPENCIPVFPLQDPVVASLPQDVIADPIAPIATARRGFFGLPLLPLLAAAGGLGALAVTADDDDEDAQLVSPA